MAFILPDDDELDAELEHGAGRDLSAEATLKDTCWSFRFTQTATIDPADVHGV